MNGPFINSANGIQKNPALIMMDEPTNHMDLPSIESVESALIESGVALLLVSHDEVFLKRTVERYWCIENGKGNLYRVVLR